MQCAYLTCEMQVKICYCGIMPKEKPSPKRRSGCPLNASVEILGDRWSLLIIRDMMLRGFRTYKEFLGSYEKIATNILADRLQKLGAHGIITNGRDSSDGRKLIYSLTAKGIGLAPLLGGVHGDPVKPDRRLAFVLSERQGIQDSEWPGRAPWCLVVRPSWSEKELTKMSCSGASISR